MIRHAVIFIMCILSLSQVDSAKQQVQLSDSYLPVAMQIIAHLTDQMAFEAKDDANAKPTPQPTTRPTARPTSGSTTQPTTQPTTRPTSWSTSQATTRPTTWSTTQASTRPTSRPTYWTTTSRPYVTNGWWTIFSTTKRTEITTPFHKPGLYAPYSPPNPSDRFSWNQHRYVLLPVNPHSQYTILGPQGTKTEGPLLSIQHETIKPLVEKRPVGTPLLPPHKFVELASRSDGYSDDELTEENLQYLSDDVRDMIKMAHNPHSDKVVDVWDGVRQGNKPAATKAKLSASNLRLLLLYDLLSREAKRQRLSDYSGFSPDVMKNLVESSNGGARAQLKMALSKMVERHDCGHEYANNRAKEMVIELGKDESGLSAELRYLQPIVYKY